MDALLSAIVIWLSLNFAIPSNYAHSKIEFVRPIEIAFMRNGAVTAESQKQVIASMNASSPTGRREAVAVYDSVRETIFLPQGWEGRSPAELSLIVHEMVHHLHAKAEYEYACPAEREKLAYEAQEQWLNLFGKTLQSEFEIDALTLKISTSCGF